jgi:hypothetical protein
MALPTLPVAVLAELIAGAWSTTRRKLWETVPTEFAARKPSW